MTNKRTINVGANKGKMGKAPPAWALNLKDGIYTIRELMEISGTKKANTHNFMKKYAIKSEYEEVSEYLKVAKYHWNHDHFIKIFYKNDLQNKEQSN